MLWDIENNTNKEKKRATERTENTGTQTHTDIKKRLKSASVYEILNKLSYEL